MVLNSMWKATLSQRSPRRQNSHASATPMIRNGMRLPTSKWAALKIAPERMAAPLALMGYANPLLAYGEERAAADAAAAGADGFIVVDLPPEEAGDFRAACARHGVSFVPLVAPTTAEARMARVAAAADSFIYCVSVTGTTGQRAELSPEIGRLVAAIRRHTGLPVAVGFGVSTRAQAEAVGRLADGVIVGSAIIAAIEAGSAEDCAARARACVARMTGRDGARA